MVSLPDDLLGSIDAEAVRRNTTRSGLLRDYAQGPAPPRAGAGAACATVDERNRSSRRSRRRGCPATPAYGVTAWFVDASVLLAREDRDDDQHEAAGQLLAGDSPVATLDLAFYEVGDVAVRAWRDTEAADRLRSLVEALAADGGLVRVDEALTARAVSIANAEGLSVYDAGYVAGAARAGARLVSCDLRDLVSRNLAVTPQQAWRTG